MKIMPDVVGVGNIVRVLATENARDAARKMLDRKKSCLVVVDQNGLLQGIVTDRDFTRVLVVGGSAMEDVMISDLMTADPDTLQPDDHPRAALDLMELRGFRHLPVVDAKGHALAVVTILDLYDALMRANQEVMAKTQQFLFGERYNPDL